MTSGTAMTRPVRVPALRHQPRRARAALGMAVTAVLILALTVIALPQRASAAADPCGIGGNKIACENTKAGNPASEWDITGAGADDIQGFSTDISVNVGQRVDFKIDTDASSYSVNIYRTGYYQGNGARKIATVAPTASLPQHQPQCITDAATELYDCGNWGVSASWNVPATAVSGVYFALLHRNDNGNESHVTFIVRDDASTSQVVFQTSDPTWQAYNTYGGSDFYQGGGNGRAYKISYNRPVLTREGTGGRDFYFSNEFPLVRFLEKNGYDVSYIAGVDSDRRGNLLTNHNVFLSVGHDEYWSAAQRTNVEAARDAGVNLQFLSGNEVYWKTRYEASADAGHTPYRTLVSYKETWSESKIDPSPEWTGTWRDPRFAPKARGGGNTENRLTGTAFMSNVTDLPITVSKAEGKLRLWRNTGLSSMIPTTTALAPHTVGYESDEAQDNGSSPPGLIKMSTTTGNVPQYMYDYGSTTGPHAHTHNITLYRAPSGALVFGAGTVQWTWGLDSTHDAPDPTAPADKRMQQAQVNLLADMGAQPTTLDTQLVAATKSTDTTGPTVSITSPTAGSAQANGKAVTVTGTATDSGGGVVAGVEYSTDGGTTWHTGSGGATWSFTYIQHGTGSVPLRVRAMDDSANIGSAVTRSFAVACPCSVFGAAGPSTTVTTDAGVATPAADDSSSAELGMRFTAVADGFVTGVRFYKGTGNTGTHVGSLWSTSGQRLGSVTFTGETATGWQTATFASPVSVSAGTTYVVSYTVPNGHYANQPNAFSAAGRDSDPLQVDGGYGATPAGVYADAGDFPNLSYQNSNYFVDVTFTTTDGSPLIATNQWPLADSTSVATTATVSAKFSKPVTAGTQGIVLKDQLGATVAGAAAYDATTRTITFTPSAPLQGFVKYTATLSGTDTQGNSITTGKTWSFTTAKPPAAPGVCPCTLFDDGLTPTVIDTNETRPVTLGVRFASTIDGKITGMRFYKGPANTGTHVGTLWSANGTALASATFTQESTSGWQSVTFAQPVSITKNTEYVVSYRSNGGSYPVTPNAFAASDLSRSPLKVDSDSGAYTYGSGFPDYSAATNYLVDPVFEKNAPSIAVVAQSPASAAVDVPTSAPVTVWFSEPIRTGYSLTLKQGTTTIAGATTLSTDGASLTFRPTATLPADVLLTATLSGVVSTDGAALPTQTWSFRTASATQTPTQSLFSNQTPAAVAADDPAAVQLGTVFTPSRAGTIKGIRFYKGTGNGGTHVGSIWSMAGQRLGTVTFSGETPTGWQTATLATPVPVTAGTSYVVSYHAPQGHYSYTPRFFDSPLTNGDLTGPASENGRYIYGGSTGYPAYTYQATSYFVDVVFAPTP